jgi:hypothetical protein
MAPKNNNIKGIKNVKPCPNGCRTWIAYNERLNRFIEAKSGEIHQCPKWKPNPGRQRRIRYNKIKTLSREELTRLDPASLTMEDMLSIHQENLKMLEDIERRFRALAELARQNAGKSK